MTVALFNHFEIRPIIGLEGCVFHRAKELDEITDIAFLKQHPLL
jgi:hypothetical protein